MVTSRTYHALHLDIASYPSERICYVILPEKLKESEHQWLISMAEKHSSNFVIISGVNWETDLTPWKAPGLKGGEFERIYLLTMAQIEYKILIQTT